MAQLPTHCSIDMTDPKQLIRRYCRDQDAAAFRAFYQAQAGRLWRFLLARGCHQDLAYDIVSESFLRFCKTICCNPSEPVAFLFRIAINLHTDMRRRQQSQAINIGASIENYIDEGSPEAAEHEFLMKKINMLHEDEQNLLLMRYWLGFSHKEVAATLGRPEGTVRRQCTEAINKLRDQWGHEE